MPLLSVDDLSFRYERHGPWVLRGLRFDVHAAEVFAIVGASGCGKTTLLRCLAGFETPTAGAVVFDQRTLLDHRTRLPPEQRGMGVVFQDYALFPHLSVHQNIAFGLKHLPRAQRRDTVQRTMAMVGLAGLDHRMPGDLSGGQQQRVALARSIAPGPKLILLDEPFSNLDASLRQATRDELQRIIQRTGMSAILVTHDQEEALSIADRIAVMDQGRLVQVGKPQTVYDHPRTPFVARFLGRTNLLRVHAEGRNAHTPLGPVRLDRRAEGEATISIRPEHLRLAPANPEAPAGVGADVESREFKGHDVTYRLRIGAFHCLAHADRRHTFEPGERVEVTVAAAAAVVDP